MGKSKQKTEQNKALLKKRAESDVTREYVDNLVNKPYAGKYRCGACGELLSERYEYITHEHNGTSDCIWLIIRCQCRRLNVYEMKGYSYEGELVNFSCNYDESAIYPPHIKESDVYVSCALIESDNKLLLCQRGKSKHANKWEFPGGKKKTGEDPWEALKREIKEELDADLTLKMSLAPVKHHYHDADIWLQGFVSAISENKFSLKEHKDAKWVKIYDIGNYDLLEADYLVLDKYLEKRMTK